MNVIRDFFGALYFAFASWQTSPDRGMRGFSAAGMMGTLAFVLTAAVLRRADPNLIADWLQFTGLPKLLLPLTFVVVVVCFFQWKGRGWRWAEGAQRQSPRLIEHKNLLGVAAVVCVIAVLLLSYRL